MRSSYQDELKHKPKGATSEAESKVDWFRSVKGWPSVKLTVRLALTGKAPKKLRKLKRGPEWQRAQLSQEETLSIKLRDEVSEAKRSMTGQPGAKNGL